MYSVAKAYDKRMFPEFYYANVAIKIIKLE
jgi:hypothetical protein